MKIANLFKRNKNYYIRFTISPELLIYFDNKREYIRSLKTTNTKDAKIIAKYLNTKFKNIKESSKMLSNDEILKLVNEFKTINYENIVAGYSLASVEEIDNLINDLNSNKYLNVIYNEMRSILELLTLKDEDSLLYGVDEKVGNLLEKHIIQIKIEALNEAKRRVNGIIKLDDKELEKIINISSIESNKHTIKDVVGEFNEFRLGQGITERVLKASGKDVEMFVEFCKKSDIEYIEDLSNKNLIAYRNDLKTLKPNASINTLNANIRNVITFLNYCHEQANYIGKITKNFKFTKTITDIVESKRENFDKDELEKIFSNIDLIKHPKNKTRASKYANEYEMILKLALYTGARINEICQLRKKDIKRVDGVYFIDINVEDGKEIKNLSSIRKVPIHSKIEKELEDYLNGIDRERSLFTIKSGQLSIDFGYFKGSLGFGPKFVLHGFRHTFQNALKQKGVDFNIINELVGHGAINENKITNDYTNKYNLKILKEAIEELEYGV